MLIILKQTSEKHRQTNCKPDSVVSAFMQADKYIDPCNFTETDRIAEFGITLTRYPEGTGVKRFVEHILLQKRQPFEQQVIGRIVQVNLQPLLVGGVQIIIK